MISVGEFANDLPGQTELSDISGWLREESSQHSALDAFWERAQEILSLGTQSALDQSELVGRLLVLAAVAAAERYFRTILGATLTICPIARLAASKKSIPLSGLMWHGSKNFLRNAFDETTFCSSDEIVRASREFIGFTLGNDQFETCLREYDKVCNLRHSIVHVDGVLPCKNALKLSVPGTSKTLRVAIRYDQLQEVVATVNTLILLYNRQLFEEMCLRWAVKWRQRSDWTATQADASFKSIWKIYVPKARAIRSAKKGFKTQAQCKAALNATFGL